MRLRIVLTMLALVLGASLFAQEAKHCEITDTPIVCWHRFVPAIPPVPTPADATNAQNATQKAVSTANTGLVSIVGPAGSTVVDFLSLISASFQSATLNQNGQAFTFDWNPRVAKDQPLKLELVLARPELSSTVKTQLANNTAALSTLKDSLSDLDDITGSATWSPVTESYGRSIAPHRIYFSTILLASLPDRATLNQKRIEALRSAGYDSTNSDKSFEQKITDPDQRQATMDAFEAAARAAGDTAAIANRLTNAFALLLNNQPQPYGSVIYHSRRNVVGADEVAIKATYEYGFRNLNTFRTKFGATCDQLVIAGDGTEKRTAAASCADLLVRYAGDAGSPDTTAADPGRVSISLEYHDARKTSVDIPADSLKFDIAGGRTLVGSLAWGRVVVPNQERKSGRIDVSASYESVRNAKAITAIMNPAADVRDRFIASITYTQKISDSVTFPLSLVYANHASFLTNVDRKLNAHFGLQYKIPAAP